ncbi:MAG: FAD-dependent oxidoreductase [Acholeplasmataceae bacterium]|jgi:thioredoxin reductase (NADPH)|nr:FAD-dependent oxidoreductase [Acholeplasmataceae bacterium]
MYDLIIIGAGPAGMTAAIYAKRANLNLLIVEKSAPGGQMVSTGEVENYPGAGLVTGPQLSMSMYNHAEELGVNFEFGEVTSVKVNDRVKEVTLDGEQVLKTKALLIATGAVPRTLNVPGEEKFSGQGISWCAICDGAFYKDRKVVFVGGGNSAVDEAIYMANVASEIEVVQNLPTLTADKISADRLLSLPNVKVHYNSVVKEFVGEDKLEAVKIVDTDGNETLIPTEGVFEYVGLRPVTELFKDLDILNDWGYVEADNQMKTKVDGIFSAGDVNSKAVRQIVTATSDGAIAVQSILKYLESWK